MENIKLTTADNIELAASLWDEQAFASIICLHQMPATKESWNELAEKLGGLGFNVLAFDFRGHGQSGGGDYKQFSDDQHQEYTKDLVAAVDYLNKNYPHTEIYLVGASIGANIALKYMARHPEVSKGVGLSPGLDYHGVRAIDDVKTLDPVQKILLVGAKDDSPGPNNTGQQVEQLYEVAEGVKEKLVFDTGGHGTNMFSGHPELIDQITEFLTT